ncbi:MAG: hypothetical protein IPL40_02080 [Proteobacteria bacterium]|nr:hypothetical protein [Pseudomonadota bacterium]
MLSPVGFWMLSPLGFWVEKHTLEDSRDLWVPQEHVQGCQPRPRCCRSRRFLRTQGSRESIGGIGSEIGRIRPLAHRIPDDRRRLEEIELGGRGLLATGKRGGGEQRGNQSRLAPEHHESTP